MKLDFSEVFIAEVKAANDIVEIASEYFELHEAGGLYKAHCKHPGGDKTPSLTFFPDTQSYYCFSCHAGKRGKTSGSDIISFIEWVEGISWQDSIIYLAKRKGLKVPDAELSEEDKKKQKLYDKILDENRLYWAQIQDNKKTLEWFSKKNITEQDIAKWRLGADGNNPVYAIIDEFGRTVAFSKRIGTDKNKYVNDITSPIFKKGEILYGLNFIKKEIRKLGYIVIVEGFNDAIQLQKYSIPAVAIMGTSLTDGQIALIKKYTNNVILFLDGDEPGIASTVEHIKGLKKEKVEVEVVNILGFDPDDVAIKYKNDTGSFINKTKRVAFQFLINNILNEYFDNMIRLKKETIKQLEEILNYIDDETEKEIYRKQLIRIVFIEEKDTV